MIGDMAHAIISLVLSQWPVVVNLAVAFAIFMAVISDWSTELQEEEL